MPEFVRLSKLGHAERRVPRSQVGNYLANGWLPVWDQDLQTLATTVAQLQEAVIDLGDSSGGSPVDGGENSPPVGGGADGKSAYELAVEAGFNGSLSQWLASLVGPPGEAGPAGEPGATSTVPGPAGPPGADSTVPGPPGADGKSAYLLARDGGYGGTQTQWLASLIGAQGPQGQQGAQGPQGIQGNPGSQGIQGIPGTPGPNLGRRVIVNTGALTANTVKTVTVTWPTAMPDTAYAVTALIESTTPQNVAIGVNPSSRTNTGCTLSVRSTVAVNATGLNVHVIGLA